MFVKWGLAAAPARWRRREKSLCCAASMACWPRWFRSTNFGLVLQHQIAPPAPRGACAWRSENDSSQASKPARSRNRSRTGSAVAAGHVVATGGARRWCSRPCPAASSLQHAFDQRAVAGVRRRPGPAWRACAPRTRAGTPSCTTPAPPRATSWSPISGSSAWPGRTGSSRRRWAAGCRHSGRWCRCGCRCGRGRSRRGTGTARSRW